MNVEKTLLDYVNSELLEAPTPVNFQTSLFEGKVLDSMKLAELIGFIEDEFQIRVLPTEIAVANMDSVERLAGYVRRKKT